MGTVSDFLPWAFLLLLGVLCSPGWVALLLHGTQLHLPGQEWIDHWAKAGSYERKRQLGRTRFADAASYHHFKLPDGSRQLYEQEGYVVLRGLLPKSTVAALRKELFERYSFEQEKNAQYDSDALLDFLVSSPLGEVAAQLLGASQVHLIRNVLHFRPTLVKFKRVPTYHFDWLECEEELPTEGAPFTGPSPIKFNVALYDEMPGLWLLNRSTLGSLMEQANLSGLKASRAGLEPLGDVAQLADSVALQPVLNMGDVVAHSAALAHRSPDAGLGSTLGFVSPSYAASSSRCLGRRDSNRECKWEALVPSEEVPTLGEVAGCFPQAYPALKGPRYLNVTLRENFSVGPLKRILANLLTRWLFLAPGAPPTAALKAAQAVPPDFDLDLRSKEEAQHSPSLTGAWSPKTEL